AVTDLGQTSTEDQKADGKSEGGGSAEKLVQHGEVEPTGQEEQPTTPSSNTEGAQVGSDTGGLTFLSPYSSRPAIGGVAMPFKLASPPPAGVNASTLTLASVEHGVPPVKEVKKEEDGSAVATPENDMKEEKTVIGEGSVVESEEASASRKRPEPQTFITAWEGQELRESQSRPVLTRIFSFHRDAGPEDLFHFISNALGLITSYDVRCIVR
ncbi:MAG: hypothetical protein Q9157_003904, partial [Trypethelium eluteriae]